MMRNVLVVGAHFDDIEMNAGASMAKWVRGGRTVVAAVLAGYDRHGQQNGVRKGESMAALSLLSGDILMQVLHGTDTRLDAQVPELVAALEELVERHKIDTVVTHFHADTHQDHVAAYKIAVAAARRCPSFLMFKPTYPSGRPDVPFHPNVISRVDKIHIDMKMRAMACHESQCRKYGHENWLGALTATAQGDAWTYGGFHGYAEVFQAGRVLV